MHCSIRYAACGLCLALLSTGSIAGATEDFAAGEKVYRQGDLVGALPLLRSAADAGHAKAQALLAYILDKSDFSEEALEYYLKSANQGEAEGQYGLGAMYAAGEGTKQNNEEARRWIMRAAEQGHVQAINVMAESYLRGGLGIPESERNTKVARMWVQKAAENDHLPAIDALVKAYKEGDLGLEKNVELATQWQAKANKIRNIQPGKKSARRVGDVRPPARNN